MRFETKGITFVSFLRVFINKKCIYYNISYSGDNQLQDYLASVAWAMPILETTEIYLIQLIPSFMGCAHATWYLLLSYLGCQITNATRPRISLLLIGPYCRESTLFIGKRLSPIKKIYPASNCVSSISKAD